MSAGSAIADIDQETEQAVKCLVWDLDNTLWDGVLLEDPQVSLRPEVADIVRTLDERGILHSIASRNDHGLAMEKLRQFELADYFLCPQINWNPKSASVEGIAKNLCLALDTFAFVDDQPFERAEVSFAHPKVLCIDAAELSGIPALKRMHPRFITEESKSRRLLYMSDGKRRPGSRNANSWVPVRNSLRNSIWSSPYREWMTRTWRVPRS